MDGGLMDRLIVRQHWLAKPRRARNGPRLEGRWKEREDKWFWRFSRKSVEVTRWGEWAKGSEGGWGWAGGGVVALVLLVWRDGRGV